MALFTSYALDPELLHEAARNASLPSKQASATMASMGTSVLAAPAAAPAPSSSNRERGAKLLFELCNATSPQERDRLTKELDAHLMQNT